MASNGSKSVAVTAYDTLKFSWAQVGQSVANNTTTISWSLQLVASSAGEILSSVAKAWSVTINGATYNFCIESDLCNGESDVYAAAKALQIGDVINLEGFLYWYAGANPHITAIAIAE